MKLLLVICSLLTVAVAQDPSLSCRYYNFTTIYGCELTINNPNGFNDFTGIGGIHLEGFTDADVNVIYRVSGQTTNIPRIICETFPNIFDFEIYGTLVSEIDDNSLSGCTAITNLYLYYNRISSISANAFANLRELSYLNLGSNSLTTLPENVFANQQSLTDLSLSSNPFTTLPSAVFQPLESLRSVYLDYTNLNAINSAWFTANSNLISLSLGGNRIALSADTFAGLQQLRTLGLSDNGINEIPAGTFAGLTNLQSLQLYWNNLTVLGPNSFPDLQQLISLDLSSNPIQVIDDDAFQGLESLTSLYLSNCRIRNVNANSFAAVPNITNLDLNFNEIETLPVGAFTSMPNLYYIGLWNNRVKTLRRASFGTLTELRTLDLDGNIVNAIDRSIIDDAVNLDTLYFQGNLCANNWFFNFLISRATFLQMLETCFRNMRYIVDTTTENNGVYSFFEAPQPGIVFSVQSNNEVQIALTPFDLIWTPSIEVLIGTTNNTRSVIRINEETDVVTVPTPNIVQQNQWNDFRITWANQNVLVFRGNEVFPFMSYTMQQFFPVNFYGLRAVETSAFWSVQPLN